MIQEVKRMNINNLKIMNLEVPYPTSSLTLVRNLDHSTEIPPREYVLEPELEKCLQDLLSTKDIKILIWGEANHKFVMFNTFETLKDGHLYFKVAKNCLERRKRIYTGGHPYEFRDRMAIPWSSIICMAIYLPTETAFYTESLGQRYNAREHHVWWMSYAGIKTFLPSFGNLAGFDRKRTNQVINEIMSD